MAIAYLVRGLVKMQEANQQARKGRKSAPASLMDVHRRSGRE